jgi:hypothetical protein
MPLTFNDPTEANSSGAEFYSSARYTDALAAFEEALRLSPA